MADTYNEADQAEHKNWGPPDEAKHKNWGLPGVRPDYDQATIAVGPDGMSIRAKGLSTLAGNVSGAIVRIQTTLDALALTGWKGKSQQEATDFANRWDAVMKDLFGTKEKPDDGVLNALADGVGAASGNFTKADNGINGIFTQFAAGLEGTGSSGGTPSDDLDTNNTAITADYPGN